MDTIPEGFRKCTKCGQVKPLTEFYKAAKGLLGKTSRCRRCSSPKPESFDEGERRRALRAAGFMKCSKCKQVYPASHFYGKPKEGWCRVCRRRRANENKQSVLEVWKRSRIKHADAVKARAKAYSDKNREKCRAMVKEWYWRNRDECLARARAAYAGPRGEAIRAKHRAYAKANPDKKYNQKQKRRARTRNAGGTFTAEQFRAMCVHYGNRCLCCNRADLKLEADHVVPLSRGGNNTIGNLQPLCDHCNSSKRVKIIDYRPDRGAAFAPKQASLFA